MLLFEGSHETVLYTGDFRLSRHQSSRYCCQQLSNKHIDSLYIDLTFFEPTVRHLPTREHACHILIDLIRKMTDRNIYLKTSARVGYEYIYIKLSKDLNQLIHVHIEQYRLYDCLPHVQRMLTVNACRTRLHACWPRCSQTRSSIKVIVSCNDNCNKVRLIVCSIKIILSVLWFTLPQQQQQQFTSPLVQISNDCYRLCYSLHSSYSEIDRFIRLIAPTCIHPIALSDRISLQDLNDLLGQIHVNKSNMLCSSSTTIVPRIRRSYESTHRLTLENDDDDDDSSDQLDYDGHNNRMPSESQLCKRIDKLQKISNKKFKS
jgi:DNA cross-link repair 1C protein